MWLWRRVNHRNPSWELFLWIPDSFFSCILPNGKGWVNSYFFSFFSFAHRSEEMQNSFDPPYFCSRCKVFVPHSLRAKHIHAPQREMQKLFDPLNFCFACKAFVPHSLRVKHLHAHEWTLCPACWEKFQDTKDIDRFLYGPDDDDVSFIPSC